MNSLEIISVHYKTPELIYRQYESIRKFYPNIKYRVIDGSDNNKIYFNDLEKKDNNFNVIRFGYNIHHGPGMDYGIKSSEHNNLLILDSDIWIHKPLIAAMLETHKGYAVGKKILVNSAGFESWQKTNNGDKQFIYEYIHPYCMLINKSEYLKYSPFIKHGAPCIEAMISIYKKNNTKDLISFPIEEFINLEIRGTRKKWGINL